MTDTPEKAWITAEWQGANYRVPVVGRDNNLGAMLAIIPGNMPDEEYNEERFTAHCMAFLMQWGNLGVPGGRYGTDTRDCAPVAILMAEIMAYHNGEPITYHQLDSDMGLVVNSADDVAYMIYEYGGLVKDEGFEITQYLSDEDIQECNERHKAEWGGDDDV
jgi:hypothetical protein